MTNSLVNAANKIGLTGNQGGERSFSTDLRNEYKPSKVASVTPIMNTVKRPWENSSPRISAAPSESVVAVEQVKPSSGGFRVNNNPSTKDLIVKRVSA